MAMLAVDDWLQNDGADARMIMQVHDELVLEVHSDIADEVAARVAGLMSDAASLRVPLKVTTGIGSNWDEAH
jgi:DNA polymerase-1